MRCFVIVIVGIGIQISLEKSNDVLNWKIWTWSFQTLLLSFKKVFVETIKLLKLRFGIKISQDAVFSRIKIF